MRIFYNSNLVSTLANSFLFLDATAFITAFSYEEDFGALLKNLKEQNCTILTIPSVVFEFTRGSDSVTVFNQRVEYINNIADIYPIERHLDEFQNLMVVLQKTSGQMSYTDFLLSACLYKFQKAYLLTENHKDFPTSIFERKCIITVDNEKEIRNHAVYTLLKEKLQKAAVNVLK